MGSIGYGLSEVKDLVDHKTVNGVRQFLVRWSGYNSDDDTWEKESNLSCPKILADYLEKNNL